MTARLLGPAWVDALDLADWYDRQNAGSGSGFLAAVDDLVAILNVHPRRFARVPNAPRGREVREALVLGYLVVAVYEIRAGEVIVVSLTHARSARRPWRRRLPAPPQSGSATGFWDNPLDDEDWNAPGLG